MDYPILRTVVDIPQAKEKISYSSKVMFIGSCFTEEIGEKFESYLFDTDINPFGVIYNPVSVANSLKILIQKRLFTEKDLEQRGSQWFSFYHHSRFSFESKEETLNTINERIEKSSEFLKKADFLFITLGTAWVYVLNRTGEVVSNCHKLPAKIFTRKMLETEEIVDLYSNLLQDLWSFNPKLKIYFTVSPVRHWKDGAYGNRVSKSVLFVALDKLMKRFDSVGYFPAYEIVMDELRDYRFYAKDMIHIGEQGVDYIWFRFKEKFFDEAMLDTLKEVEKVTKAIEHRPKSRFSEEYKLFVEKTLEKIMILKKNNPHIKIQRIEEHFINELKTLEK